MMDQERGDVIREDAEITFPKSKISEPTMRDHQDNCEMELEELDRTVLEQVPETVIVIV